MNAALRLFTRYLPFLPLLMTVFAFAAHAAPGPGAPVLMISIDGLKPEYVTHADEHGMKLPFLRSMMRDGTYAEGVIGIWPTITYPSHTTLLTGVWPAEHGITNNLEFDPEQKFGGAWNWYAAQIRVPTLWDAAHRAGLRTASVGWPVSVGANVDWLIPEYWRSADPSAAHNPEDRLLMAALARPATLFGELEPTAGDYMMGNDTSVTGDEAKTRYALAILRLHKPGFMTLHLSALDESQHEHGPFSAEADATLEAIDGMVARLAKQEFANDPHAVLIVVSDHGFMNITHYVNLPYAFLKAGFIQATTGAGNVPNVSSWKAELWGAGGMAAIMLHDPNDTSTAQQVRAFLDKLAADPASGIAQVLDREAIRQRGAFPEAAFLVVFKPGFYFGTSNSGDLVTPVPGARGSHGFSPEYPEMRASFFALGAGIAHRRDLGIVDMRQIAPTVAGILHAPLPTAKAASLHVAP
jgi:predicted AlkP superfamily pyrophosphatase or phosphodiesterase